ncbi:hypothetical protein HID58_066548 [Brassica napus]|uniref:Uncharacterized protein n=1 Tax=Brassica napus TaxID=3708 RepID=A0ABQ7ZFZ7_BRANA|nr:hypothetical protein HID58_066548 [Brassica napus]
MISRRWEPGIGAGDWIVTFGHDQDCDMAYQGCISGRWRFDLGFRKGIGGILRKIKIWIEGRWISGQQQDVPQVAREEGEITLNGDAAAALPSAEFQMELAKIQAEGSEVVVEAMEEERSLLAVQGMMEKHDETFDDIEMEIDAINATMMASGVDLEAEEEFQTLSEEEFEQASEAQVENVILQNAEEPVAGDANINTELGAREMAMRQSHRKRLFKPNSSTAGSTKMRMASALLSPRKKIAAKVGTRHGDNTKPPESKGPSIPKPVNLKF